MSCRTNAPSRNKAGDGWRWRCCRPGLLEQRRQEDEPRSMPSRVTLRAPGVTRCVLCPHPVPDGQDLRTETETGNTSAVLDGRCFEFIETGIRWRRSQVRPESGACCVHPSTGQFPRPVRWHRNLWAAKTQWRQDYKQACRVTVGLGGAVLWLPDIHPCRWSRSPTTLVRAPSRDPLPAGDEALPSPGSAQAT